MLKRIIQRTVKKIGAKKLLMFVFESAVKSTKNKEDDKLLEDVKLFLDDYDG